MVVTPCPQQSVASVCVYVTAFQGMEAIYRTLLLHSQEVFKLAQGEQVTFCLNAESIWNSFSKCMPPNYQAIPQKTCIYPYHLPIAFDVNILLFSKSQSQVCSIYLHELVLLP